MEAIVITCLFNLFINVLPLTYNILKRDDLLIFKTMLHCLGAMLILGAPFDMERTTEEFYITECIMFISFIIPCMAAIYQEKKGVVFEDKNKVIIKGIGILAAVLFIGVTIYVVLL